MRGEYGSGKTFFSRWLVERAKKANFASAEIQISETETPLHRLETVYRRVVENLATPPPAGALRDVVDGWFYVLDGDVLADGAGTTVNRGGRAELLERRLATVSQEAPAFAAVLRRYRTRRTHGDDARRRAAGLARRTAARRRRRSSGPRASAATSTISVPWASCRGC